MGSNRADSILLKHLQQTLKELPSTFTNTFDYTKTGNNLTHPIIWGCLINAVKDIPNVVHIGIDVRMNIKGASKFQPDIVGYNEHLIPLIAIDYESPNSSDNRIPSKDIKSYQNWIQHAQTQKPNHANFPYYIVTTLPDCSSPKWEVRYTSGYNKGHGPKRGQIRKNPKVYWYQIYKKILTKKDTKNVTFLNISGRTVRKEQLP